MANRRYDATRLCPTPLNKVWHHTRFKDAFNRSTSNRPHGGQHQSWKWAVSANSVICKRSPTPIIISTNSGSFVLRQSIPPPSHTREGHGTVRKDSERSVGVPDRGEHVGWAPETTAGDDGERSGEEDHSRPGVPRYVAMIPDCFMLLSWESTLVLKAPVRDTSDNVAVLAREGK